MFFRRWHFLILVFAIVWSGYNAYQWHTISSSLDRMSSTADDATIVRIDKCKESKGSGKRRSRRTTTYYRPVVEFEDSDHIEHTAPSIHETSNGSKHLTGDKVSVLYDPRDADSGCIIVGDEEATQSEARGKLFGAIGTLVAGTAFCVVAEMFARMSERLTQTATDGTGDSAGQE